MAAAKRTSLIDLRGCGSVGSSFNNDIRFERFTGAPEVLVAGGGIGAMIVLAGTELGRT